MRIAIIGGGAAGMMCAATVQELNGVADIFLLERNEALGKKVIISGGGRCNVTTGVRDLKVVLEKYPRGGAFLRTAMQNFPPAAVYEWFEAHGVPLKTQADERVFPVSDDGRDVVGVFDRLFATGKTEVMLLKVVTKVEKVGDVFKIHIRDRAYPLEVDRVVLTTGGQAYRQTGSLGDGYAFAGGLGHSTTSLAPSLNSFTTKEKWSADISGLSFPRAELKALIPGQPKFTGPFLFTHRGVSGPAVFALSAKVAFEKYDAQQPLPLAIDLFPAVNHEELRNQIIELVQDLQARQLVNALAVLVPKSLAEVLMRALNIPDNKRAAELSKKELHACVTWLKAVPLAVVGRGAGDEFVTAGGISLEEIDPRTMQSKICPGLYFAGELIDVDGFTGGFNLQASWATGRLAGMHVGR
jgi:predicted Rossmann fold flavoprotein